MPVKKKKKAPAAKRKTKTVKAASKKKAVRKKKAAKKSAKRPSALQRIENAVLTGVAEFDELALDMGLLGAVGPAPKKKRKKKARR